MAVWPFIFIKGAPGINTINHEKIHFRQQGELLLIFFYLLYFIFWIKELIHCSIDKDRGQIEDPRYKKRTLIHRAEHSIIFEREAYQMDEDEQYLSRRKFLAWVNF